MKIRITYLLFITLTIFFFIPSGLAQQKRSAEALFIAEPLTIDAVLDETFYQQVAPAKDFVQLEPNNGQPSLQKSEVRFFYDQNAVYVGAMLYDTSPDSIFNFLTERDEIGVSDYFGVYIDPYNEGQLAYGFFITPAGVQTDLKAIRKDYDNEESSWNAVWESKTRITEDGWVVEMRIPYAAIRFPEKAEHVWGLNMFRNIRRYNSNNSWSLVDRKVTGFIHQQGQLTGIKNINPPVRLSFSPYVATYLEYQEHKTTPEFLYKGGMDLKYGLSESFTLDVMLIPDFGQIQSDDKELNLTPYEIYYDERRQFFTEGTELFQRAGLFYSRRIGGQPKYSDKAEDDLKEHEAIDYNPAETQLLNATKVSGRSSGGWGMGFLNAMSLPSYAVIKDTISGNKRKVLTQPFTNYNVSVVDKLLKNNSYISLINSNVAMAENGFMANVIATDFQIRDKSKKFAFKGKAGISSRGDTAKENGYYAEIGLEKNKGTWQFGISQNVNSDEFNINDLGYIRRNNEMNTNTWINRQVIEPFWIIREWHTQVWWIYYRVFNPADVFGHETGIYTYVLFKNNYSFEMNAGVESNRYDYYETRVKSRYYYDPYNYWLNVFVNSDFRKPVSFYLHWGGYEKIQNDQYGFWGSAGVNVRIGSRLLLEYDWNINRQVNARGYVDKNSTEDTIYFAKRNVNTYENILSGSYIFNNKTSLKLRVRHYCSGADNKNYYLLQPNGSLLDALNYTVNHDENYNAFNIDMVFRWIFAPGSEMSVAWKNAVLESGEAVIPGYWKNLKNTWHATQANSISLKVLYYIDYNNLKKKRGFMS
ncbi:MAG: carbohydrate binding family 9 domain-containing protein [Bacteroidales bacterium]|nr:carbohydrate binding family 9 domain-containing protein [Bacteroidales bacterium]